MILWLYYKSFSTPASPALWGPRHLLHGENLSGGWGVLTQGSHAQDGQWEWRKRRHPAQPCTVGPT